MATEHGFIPICCNKVRLEFGMEILVSKEVREYRYLERDRRLCT